MNDTLFQIKKEILRGQLSKEAHHDVMQIIAELSEEQQSDLLALVCERPALIRQIYDWLQMKRRLFFGGAPEDWERVVSDELKMIEGFV